MDRPRSTSPPKSAWPGVSTMLMVSPPWRTAVFLARIVMPFSRSRSPESITRSATFALARNAPDCHSMASTSVVLPWSTCATMATLRRSSLVAMAAGVARSAVGMRDSRSFGVWGASPEQVTMSSVFARLTAQAALLGWWMMMPLLQDRVVLISGGTSGLGAAIARAAAREGALVAVTGRRREPGEALAAELTAAGTKALFVQADVADVEQARACVTAAVAGFGRVDSLVNAAGLTTPGHPARHHARAVRRAHRGQPEGAVLPHAGRRGRPGGAPGARHDRERAVHPPSTAASPTSRRTWRPRPGWPG